MLERPIVGIAQSGSGFNNCHRTMPELIEAVKARGAGRRRLPLDFPPSRSARSSCRPTS
jgi:dihydroxy-acid dehydratase